MGSRTKNGCGILVVMDQPRPTRRMDMGPRKMDGFARQRPVSPARPQVRPAAAQPVASRPAPQPQPRVASQARPTAVIRRPAVAPTVPVRPARPTPRPQVQREDQYENEQSYGQEPYGNEPKMWKVVVQFVIGLAVIAAVATAVVWLWLTYYQG